jgi:hypothetical protein
VAGFVDQLGDVEKCLRRDTAAVKADAPRIQFRVDQRDFESDIGGEECSGIAAWASADYRDV